MLDHFLLARPDLEKGLHCKAPPLCRTPSDQEYTWWGSNTYWSRYTRWGWVTWGWQVSSMVLRIEDGNRSMGQLYLGWWRDRIGGCDTVRELFCYLATQWLCWKTSTWPHYHHQNFLSIATFDMRRVPSPDPVPPPREWASWKPWTKIIMHTLGVRKKGRE